MTIGYLGLIAAVIRSGLKYESWEYPLTDDGRYWCDLGNLDPEQVSKQATKSFAEPFVQFEGIQELDVTHAAEADGPRGRQLGHLPGGQDSLPMA